MPELPEVETIRRNLNTVLANDIITSVDVLYRPVVSNDMDFESKLKNQKIHSIEREAKYLKFILDDYVLISHLRMEGKFFMDEPLRKHIHVVFNLKSGHTLSYQDTRKFGRFELIDIAYKDSYLNSKKGLAKDPKDIDFNDFYKRLKDKRKTIKEVLLDQNIIGGIGNIYANEILNLSKIHPAKKAFLITISEAQTILKYAISVLNTAVLMGGTTIDTFESLGHKGMFQQELNVHGKTGQSCRHCGDTIIKFQLKGRGTYICPTCQKSHVLAITGGIATGKSTATNYLRKKGFVVVDSDQIVGNLYKDEAVLNKIAKTFKLALPLDKAALAKIIFSDKKARTKLENILHPYVFEHIKQVKQSSNEHILFLDIPLLFESKYQDYDASILIDTTAKNQLIRLMKRNNLTETDAMLRIKAQMPLSKKRKLADYIVNNNGSIEDLYRAIEKLLERYE